MIRTLSGLYASRNPLYGMPALLVARYANKDLDCEQFGNGLMVNVAGTFAEKSNPRGSFRPDHSRLRLSGRGIPDKNKPHDRAAGKPNHEVKM